MMIKNICWIISSNINQATQKDLSAEARRYLGKDEVESYKLIILPGRVAQRLNPSTAIKEDCVLVKGVKDDDGKCHIDLKKDGGEVCFLTKHKQEKFKNGQS